MVDEYSGVGRGSDIGIGDGSKLEQVDKDYLVNKYLSDHQDLGANGVSSSDRLVYTLRRQQNLSRLSTPEPGVLQRIYYTILVGKWLSIRLYWLVPNLHYLKKHVGRDDKSCVEAYFLLVTPNA